MPPEPAQSARKQNLARFLKQELGISDDGHATSVEGAGQWRFSGPLWVWRGGADGSGLPAKGAWYFITIDGSVAAAIRAATAGRTGGFGSVKVVARVGATSWQTSLFPSKDAGGYLLPVKAAVRRAESLVEAQSAEVHLTLA